MSTQLLLRPFIQAPRSLFLVDGVGALLSAFLLGVVLVYFEAFFGIPPSALYMLAAFPVVFALFDFFNFFTRMESVSRYLRLIALANGGYCLLSLGLAFFHRDLLTIFGWAYILGEIGIVAFLARMEWQVAREIE